MISIVAHTSTTARAQTSSTGITITHGFTLQNGDVLLAIFAEGENDGTGVQSSSGGTWTQLLWSAQASGDDRAVGVLRRVVTDAGSEPSSYTVTTTGTGATQNMLLVLIQLRGVDTTTPEDATATSSSAQNDFTPANSNIVTSTADALVIIGHMASLGDGVASGKTAGAPSGGWSLLGGSGFIYDAGADLFEIFLEIASQIIASPGTVTPGSWTGSPDAGTEELIVFALAFKPAASDPDELLDSRRMAALSVMG